MSTFVAAALSLGAGASQARPVRGGGSVTISMLAYSVYEPAYAVLIANFERVYPNISVNVTYTATAAITSQLTLTELAGGNGPDLIPSFAGCTSLTSVCDLAKAGYLAPLLKEPWVKWSLPLVVSASKYGQGLFVFIPSVGFEGIFTNGDMFKKLGLQVPQTFPELLAVCQKAKADGTIPLLLPASGSTVVQHLVEDMALTSVYAQDKHWTQELKAGTVTFDGTPGWHSALQQLIDMNNAGCFEPGPAGTTSASADAEFAQGQALMYFNLTGHDGTIAAGNPQFTYSQHPFPGGSDPTRTVTQLELAAGPAVNAHSSAANQAAARTFIDFIARPAQDALFAKLQGSVTQYEFLKGQLPAHLASFAPVLADHEYADNPEQTWWNPGVAMALNQEALGLITGQTTIDDVLNAMDAAWKQGPT